MARLIKEKDHQKKRNQILDVTERLIYTKGYEEMSIQDILNELQMSKGAFYHYYGSKQILLEAMIERMQEAISQLTLPIVHDLDLGALEKLQMFFASLTKWKTAQKNLMLALLRVWYTDENAIVRQKVRTNTTKLLAPLLTIIIRQGIEEGVLATDYPDFVGEVFLSLAQDLSDSFGRAFLYYKPNVDEPKQLENLLAAYTDGLERILKAPPGSLFSFDLAEILKDWAQT